MACHVPGNNYFTDYDIQGYAFPLMTTSFMRTAKVCTLYIVACMLVYLHLFEVCACLVMSRGNIHDMHFPSYHVLYKAYAAKVCVHARMLLLMACHVPREHISLTMTSRDMRFPL